MNTEILTEYKQFLSSKSFPCIGAKASLGKDQLKIFRAGSLYSTANDEKILQFLYDFIDEYRREGNEYHSATIIFSDTEILSEQEFEYLMWKKLQSISDLDSLKFGYDDRVSSDTESPEFSFSLKEESFFIIGLHPGSSREARRFTHPALVFNPHQQFEQMRRTGKYDMMKKVVRRNDLATNGSINPMLQDHKHASEVWQYSGINYSDMSGCPFHAKHKE